MSIREELKKVQRLQLDYIGIADIEITTREDTGTINVIIATGDNKCFIRKLFWGADNSMTIREIEIELQRF
jgi:hypothetical protein